MPNGKKKMPNGKKKMPNGKKKMTIAFEIAKEFNNDFEKSKDRHGTPLFVACHELAFGDYRYDGVYYTFDDGSQIVIYTEYDWEITP